VVYLELETIVSMLLERDLQNSKSLAWCIMFEPMLREAVFKELDGARACWSIEGLARRSCSDQPSQAKAFYGCGTQFFWGINARGRRVPLCLQSSGQNKQVLRGIDDRGDHWELCYTPQAILEALREKRLLPSLFTCFLVLSFARGVTCAGGYFQGEYLPRMQEGLANALRTQAGYEDVANLVESVASYTYLSGMQAVMVRIKDDALIPAGPMEILAAGGLTDSDIQKILSLPVRDAHLASLFETVPDVAGWVIKSPAWKKSLAENCYRLLEDKVVIK
jgi:hypothetical protein